LISHGITEAWYHNLDRAIVLAMRTLSLARSERSKGREEQRSERMKGVRGVRSKGRRGEKTRVEDSYGSFLYQQEFPRWQSSWCLPNAT
jgi:hypothetical protein